MTLEANHDAVEPAFCYDGYQIVRGEYFAHFAEPSLTFNRYKIYVNMACLRKAEGTNFVQVLVNSKKRKVVILPCGEDEKDSFSWCTPMRQPRQVICPIFFAKIMNLMDWNPEYRYKMLGKKVSSGGAQLFVFDLTAAVAYPHQPQKKRSLASRPPFFPETWKNQFGVPAEEHRQTFRINVFDKYTVFSVSSKRNRSSLSEDSSQTVMGNQ